MLKLSTTLPYRWPPLPAAFGRLCVETMASHCTDCFVNQPPSGGCVLKLPSKSPYYLALPQPPSGGCVLKLHTMPKFLVLHFQPPSGGCVLKRHILYQKRTKFHQPPSGGCVLKLHYKQIIWKVNNASRLRAAVC